MAPNWESEALRKYQLPWLIKPWLERVKGEQDSLIKDMKVIIKKGNDSFLYSDNKCWYCGKELPQPPMILIYLHRTKSKKKYYSFVLVRVCSYECQPEVEKLLKKRLGLKA